MRIAYVTAGAAGMYCGSCLNDNVLAGRLMKQGHDVVLVPTYTPTRTDVANLSQHRVFFGGINVFLEQRYPWYRKMPKPVRWLLDRPSLLNWVSRFSDRTDAEDLGALTESMLMGEEGPHIRQIDELADWLEKEFKPDVVHLTNSMFLGIGPVLKRRLKCLVVCSLQGEDLFLDDLIEPYRTRVFDLLRQQGGQVDGLIATSRYYADFMAEHVGFERSRIHIVPLGIEAHDFERSKPLGNARATLGFFARQSPEKGLDNLVDAFIAASRELNGELQLRVAGYVANKDVEFIAMQKKKLEQAGLADQAEFLGELTREQKVTFLHSLDLMSVPTNYHESKGLSVLEAMAAAVPVVQPAHGVFPEMIELTGGGVLYEAASGDALVSELVSLVRDETRRQELGSTGSKAVRQHYHAEQMAQLMTDTYTRVLKGGSQHGSIAASG